MSLKFEHTEVLGWEHAIRGMRNPLESWERSDSNPCGFIGQTDGCEGCCNYIEGVGKPSNCFDIGPNDLDLMTRLRNAGTDHRKFMRMITVYVDITGPLYWWKEFDTYKVGTVANSCSTMHKIAAKEFTLEDFSTEHLFGGYEYEMTPGSHLDKMFPKFEEKDGEMCFWMPIVILEQTIGALNFYRQRYLETKDKNFWWQMIQLLPTSYNQKRTVMLNYEVLANIAKEGSRRHHKQDEWRVDFMNWIRTLPYNELIFGEQGTGTARNLKGEMERKNEIHPERDEHGNLLRGMSTKVPGTDPDGVHISLDGKAISEDAKKLIEKALTEDMNLGFTKE